MVSRKLVEDTELAGRRFPAGTRVALPIVHFGRDPVRYPDPERFDPDRWVGREVSPSSFETLPFGSGAHFCLGYHLAWLEMVELAIALGLACKEARVVPHFEGPEPRAVWFPLAAPDARATLRFVVARR
jgi:cytochrome P450 monooxygenase